MKLSSDLRTKLTFYLLRRQAQEGFTLLELLVVMIFISVFAAVALPNLIRQAGKAREVEFKNTVGTINRAQQAYHWEKSVFAQGATDAETLNLLNLNINSEYISSYNIVSRVSAATLAPTNTNYQLDQTRAYSGATFFSAGAYSTVVCQSSFVASAMTVPISASDCGSDADKVR